MPLLHAVSSLTAPSQFSLCASRHRGHPHPTVENCQDQETSSGAPPVPHRSPAFLRTLSISQHWEGARPTRIPRPCGTLGLTWFLLCFPTSRAKRRKPNSEMVAQGSHAQVPAGWAGAGQVAPGSDVGPGLRHRYSLSVCTEVVR